MARIRDKLGSPMKQVVVRSGASLTGQGTDPPGDIVGTSRRTVSAQCHLDVDAGEVYYYWNERLAFPHFIPGLLSVEIIDGIWSRWTMQGCSQPVEVETTDNVLHRYVAWRLHQHYGQRVSLWIEPGPDEGTVLLRLELSWRPDPDAAPVAAQQQRADTILERFQSFVRSELGVGTSSALRLAAEPATTSG
jgi:hypothetical protein